MSITTASPFAWRQASGAEAGSGHVHYGLVEDQALTTQFFAKDQLIAVPFVYDAQVNKNQGGGVINANRSATIDALTVRVNAAASGTIAQLGLYAVECAQYPIPTRIVAPTSGDASRGYALNVTSTSINNGVQVVSLHTPADGDPNRTYATGRLYWLAALFSGSAQVFSSVDGAQWAVFGYDPVSFSAPYACLVASWAGSATMPNTYPAVFSLSTALPPGLGLRITNVG